MQIFEFLKKSLILLLTVCIALQCSACSRSRSSLSRSSRANSSSAQPISRRQQLAHPTGDLDSGDVISRCRAAAEKDASNTRGGRLKGSSSDLEDYKSSSEPSASSDPASSVPEADQGLYERVIEGLRAAEYPMHLDCSYDEFLDVYAHISDDPSIFWIRGYSASYSDLFEEVDVYFIYTHETPDEIQKAEQQIEAVVAECLADIPPRSSNFEKALYLHDWLAEKITYVSDGGWLDQTIYGALVLKECVCAGFSQAFTYLARKAGLDAYTIIGYATAEIVNTIGNEPNHAWNALTIDGSTCYLDVTWDNSDTLNSQGEEYILHSWFGVDRDEMLLTHVPTNSSQLRPTTTDQYNYFAVNGYLMDSFDYQQAAELCLQQLYDGYNMLELKFSTQEDYQDSFPYIYALLDELDASSVSINDVLHIVSYWK